MQTQNAKHTPGPWTIKAVDQAFAYVEGQNVLDGKPGTVATVLLTGDDFSEANARLIAACPTMYAFVKAQAEAGNKEALAILGGID